MIKSKKRGGFREGAGRKKGESSTVVRVPDGILSEVKDLIKTYKSSKAPKSTSKQPNPPKLTSGQSRPPKSPPEPHVASERVVLESVSVDMLLKMDSSREQKPQRRGSSNRSNRKKKNKKR